MSPKTSVIVIDDEPALLRLIQAYLERLGYQVEGFANSTDALKRFEEEPQRFQIAVTDLTLDGMPGNELGIAMLKTNPDLNVLLCSGYPFDVESLPADCRARFSTLQKPFLPNMLAKMIEELLSRKQ